MVDKNANELDRVFHALSDPTRREILRQLADGEHSVTDLARPFNMSLAAVSKHIKVLEKAGLIQQRQVGRERRSRLNRGSLDEAAAVIHYLQQFWDQQLDSLDAHL